MKRLDISAIKDSAQLRLKSGTLQFLQDANLEVFATILKFLIGSTYSLSTVYVLYGCVFSETGSTGYIHDGAVFYNGEVFIVDDGYSYSLSGANPMFNIIVSNDPLDPVTFTDTTTHNVHNVRKMSFVINGSGITNYVGSNPVRLDSVTNPNNLIKAVIPIGDWNMTSTGC